MSTAGLLCGRCESPLDVGDLRCPICARASPAVAPDDLPTTAVEVLRCTGCGAAAEYDVAARAPRCPFCGSTQEVETPPDPLEEPDGWLAFTVDRARAESALRRWLAGLGWFRPSDLRTASRIESIRPLWWVAWAFDAEATVSWTADSDAGAGRADWAPHAGRTDMLFEDIVVSASRGLTTAETAALADSYRFDTAGPDRTDGPAGATVERFDVPRSTARRQILAAIERVAEQRLTTGAIPGRRFRHIRRAILLRRLVTRRLGLPAWVLAYRYRKQLYRVVLSGQDDRRILGSAPRSTAKIVGVVAAALAALLVLLLAVS